MNVCCKTEIHKTIKSLLLVWGILLLSKTNGTKENFFLDLFYSGTDTKEDTFLSVNNLPDCLLRTRISLLYKTRVEIKSCIISSWTSSYSVSSVAQSCPALCDPMDCNTPEFPIHHQFPELAQTHVLWVGGAIQPSHPMKSPAFSLFQHQGLLFVCFCFDWRLITLQYCSGFAIQWHESAVGVHVFPILNPPSHLRPHPIPLGRPSAPALSTLSHALNLEWWSVSHMIMYVFPCYSLKSSHPRLLPQSPKDFYTRVIVTISKFCIYALVYCIGVYLSGLLHSA